MSDYSDYSDETTSPEAPDANAPDWNNPGDVCRWYGEQTIELIGRARKEKSITRLRALSGALDTWQRLFKLASETSELAELRAELDDLRKQIEAEKGIRAVK